MNTFLADVKGWLKKPYDENGSVLDWVLFLGLMTVITILWTRVIKRLID